MKKLSINITKAQLTGFTVSFEEKDMSVSANIALLTEENKQISTFNISTDSWRDENKFELPIAMIVPIQKIAAALEKVIIDHVREGQLKLA